MKPFDFRLLRYARSSRKYILLVSLFAISGAIATIGQALLLVNIIIGLFEEKKTFSDLKNQFLCLAVIFLIRALISNLSERMSSSASSRIRGELRSNLLKSVLRDGATDSNRLGSAQLTLLATRGIENLDGYFAKFLPQLLIAATVPFVMSGVIASRDFVSGMIIAFTLPLIPIFGVLIGRFSATATKQRWQILGQLSGYFRDLLSGIGTLKVYGRMEAQEEKIELVGDSYRRETMRVLRISFLSSLALELVATLSVALLAVSIGLRLVNGSLSLATGLLILILAPEVYWPIREVAKFFHASADGLEVFERLFPLLEKKDFAKVKFSSVSEICWSELEVSFDGRSAVRIPKGSAHLGEIHCISGASGSGKSTFASILLGFTHYSSGEVLLQTDAGTISLVDADLSCLRNSLSWLSQEPRFPRGSIEEILRHAQPGCSDRHLETVLNTVGIQLSDLQNGLQTSIGTLTTPLSVGQQRRIALARAILKPSKFLILDEPTASVDDLNEEIISKVIFEVAKSGRGVLLISHRPMLIGSFGRDIVVTRFS